MARNADDLLADLDQLGTEEQTRPRSAASKPAKATAKPAAAAKEDNSEEDALAELEKQLAARPSTPRVNSTTTSTTGKSPKRSEYTPASTSVGSSQRNSSEDRLRSSTAQARSSGEANRSFHQGHTPDDEASSLQAQASAAASKAVSAGSGWFGSVFSAATAAVRQAETLAKELGSNEEAQKWAEQVRGYSQNLQSFGTDLRSRALPTLTSLMSHIAPPISAHERLQIHTTHDIQNYPSLDPLIYAVFSRIMAQVEGGDLLVIQRGSESRSRASTEATGYRGGMLGGGNGWTDNAWWEEKGLQRSLGAVPGLKEGSRLVRVSAESYAKEFFDARGGLEDAVKRATESLSESNPVRSSDIFLAVQAISHAADHGLFAADAHTEKSADSDSAVNTLAADEVSLTFAVYLYDPVHNISYSALSQPFPQRWAEWLDASAAEKSELPDGIGEIIAAGGVDPREWVAEWLEEILSLAVGIVAQRYVAKRMGVGEGVAGQSRARVAEAGVGGEAARAL